MSFNVPIPGETPIDPSGLKVKGVTNRRELSEVEAENVRKAVARYLAKKPTKRQAPFDLAWAKKLHGQMFGDVWKWAGSFRQEDLNIGVSWKMIEVQLYELLQNLQT